MLKRSAVRADFQPLQVAIALSLLLAEVTAPPLNETVCTFAAQPQLHAIQEGSLLSKVLAPLLKPHCLQ